MKTLNYILIPDALVIWRWINVRTASRAVHGQPAEQKHKAISSKWQIWLYISSLEQLTTHGESNEGYRLILIRRTAERPSSSRSEQITANLNVTPDNILMSKKRWYLAPCNKEGAPHVLEPAVEEKPIGRTHYKPYRVLHQSAKNVLLAFFRLLCQTVSRRVETFAAYLWYEHFSCFKDTRRTPHWTQRYDGQIFCLGWCSECINNDPPVRE